MTGNEIAEAVAREVSDIALNRLTGECVFGAHIRVDLKPPPGAVCFVCWAVIDGPAIATGMSQPGTRYVCCDRITCRKRAADNDAERDVLLKVHVYPAVTDPADACSP